MADERGSGWLRRRWMERHGSVRLRTTFGAVLVVGIALLVAAVAMVTLLRQSLTENVRTAAFARAEAIAELLAVDAADLIRLGNDDDEFVQVLDERSHVVLSSANAQGDPLVDLSPGASEEVSVPFEDDPFLAVATSAETPEGDHTVLVGRTLETVLESSQVVVSFLLIGPPLLLLIVGAVTWRVVGRALAPVDSMRAQVDAISSEELHRRLPTPDRRGDEIGRLALTLNQMLQRLEEAQARQRRFVSDASHELRSPVTAIRQHAEVALEHPENDSDHDLAEIVLAEDLRLQRLVEDLLLLARMDEHSDGIRKRVLDLDDVVFEEVEHLRQVNRRTIDTTRVSAGRVSGDRKQLARLTGNLLDNALRHAESEVIVSLGEEGDNVVLRVDDDGSGVARADRRRILERFVRLQEARDRDTGGSGLGLAIVAEVAHVHGGTTQVGDSPLGGARFEIRLPRVTG